MNEPEKVWTSQNGEWVLWMLNDVVHHKGTHLQLIKYSGDHREYVRSIAQFVMYLTDPRFANEWHDLPKYVRRAVTEYAMVYLLTAPRPLPLYIGD